MSDDAKQSSEGKPSKADKGGHAAVPDDVKAKFKAALERKQAHTGKDVSADDGDKSKVHHSHGPETSGAQQMFRRKSGG